MLTNISRPSVVDVQQPFTAGDLFVADTANTVAKLPDVAVGNALLSGGVGSPPAYGKVVMSTAISGILPSVNGGTGVANAGTITNASNTTITGGGTVALGGFTLTVPATGTADLLGTAQTISALKTLTGGLTLTTTDAILTDVNIVVSSVTGTKFGTSTAQKLAFYNSTPVAQQTGDVLTALATGKLGLIASPTISATTLTGIVPSANGGTGVNNAGTLTNASNTTITGGGTLALGGFTLTIPATGTAGLLGTIQTWNAANTFSAITTISNATAGGVGTGALVLSVGGASVSGAVYANNIVVTGTGSVQGGMWIGAADGLNLRAKTGSVYDFVLNNAAGTQNVISVVTGSTACIFGAGITVGSATLITTNVALTNGAAAALGTLTNAPVAGNPTKWVPINDNGTTRYLPVW